MEIDSQRVGLTPDQLLRIPTPDGVGDRLGKIKVMSAGGSRYPAGKTEKQADRRARELPGSYRRPLERLDQQVRGTAPGETGALVARLQGFGDLLCLVAGAWGDSSKDLHQLVQICAESRVDHFCRSTGRPELEGKLSVIVSQYRRLLSTCNLHCSSPGPVPHFSSWCHLSPGKRGCSAERGDGEDGEAIEGR